MSVDTISNLVSIIKNASLVNKTYVEVNHTKESENVVNVLKDTGFVEDVKVFKEKDSIGKKLKITLAYEKDGTPKITDIKRVSKPGRRIYVPSKNIKPVVGGYGINVVSTNRGVMTGEQAKIKKLGGEIICKVW